MWEIRQLADGQWAVFHNGTQVGQPHNPGPIRRELPPNPTRQFTALCASAGLTAAASIASSYSQVRRQWRLQQEMAPALEAMTAAAGDFQNEIAPEARGGRIYFEFGEGEETVDGRLILADATNFDRPPPLPIMLMVENSDWGHVGARLAGVVDSQRRGEGNLVIGEGYLLANGVSGPEAEMLVSSGGLTTWSPDMANMIADVICTEEDEDGWCIEARFEIEQCTIIGYTIAPLPALTNARCRMLTEAVDAGEETPQTPAEVPDDGDEGDDAARPETEATALPRPSLVAASIPVAPPAEWFDDPAFQTLTPMTITEDGRVFGHLAPWDSCHLGADGMCLVAQPSATEYAYFHLGELVTCDEGCPPLSVGQITVGSGHAPVSWGADWRRVTEHYDNTGWAAADVRVGEDAFGPWYAGALRPDLTDAQMRELRAAKLSGDWRRVGGSLELVGIAAVNIPGFPIARMAASGAQDVLVAAGVRALYRQADDPEARLRALERRLLAVERVAGPLRATAASAYMARISASSTVQLSPPASSR